MMFSIKCSINVLTICGYFWSLIDYGSDIWVGVDYHNKCHFKWAITTFVISFMPNIVFVIWLIFKSEEFKNKFQWKSWWAKVFIVIFGILIIMPIVAFLLPIIHGFYVYKVLKKRRNDQNCVQNANNIYTQKSQSDDPECVIKRFKTLTMFCESIPQFIFTSYCYVRAFHGNGGNEGWIQIASMAISFFSIVFGLLNRHRFYYRDTQKIKYCSIGTLKRILVITMDVSLKLSVIILSVILFGIEVALMYIFLFTILLMIPNYVYFHEYKRKHKTRNWFWYSVEILHLVLTNISFEMDFERDRNDFKLKEITNRLSLYIIFLFGLCGITWNIHGSLNNVFVLENEIATAINSTISCENLCNALDLDCSKHVLTLTNVEIWNYINWGFFAVCCIRLLKDVWKIRKKIQSLTKNRNDALTLPESTPLQNNQQQ